jgi:hypothetical protein
MFKRILAATLFFTSFAAYALQPYIGAEKLAAGDLAANMAAVEKKLAAAGFAIIGKHTPKGIAAGSIVVTDSGLTDAVKAVGGAAIAAAPLRVGVKADGTVSYINPEYWLRGFVRKDYAKVEAAGKAAAAKLQGALGAGQPFGGDVPAGDLASYRYMFGMERFDSSSEIRTYDSFDQALKAVRDNLAKGVAQTAKVYEIVVPEKKLAVLGFAQNSAEKGEGWWINKIGGVDHIAAMPWEIIIVDKEVHALQGRFRTAFSWPALTMGQFMGISMHPEHTRKMAEEIAGY